MLACPLPAGLLTGLALDALLGDPRPAHPVAGFGRLAAALEHRTYADSRARGAVHAVALVGGAVAGGRYAERVLAPRPPLHLVALALGTWAVVGGTTLGREAGRLHAALAAGDLGAARARLPHLCGRDPRHLPAGELARATVESVAENTSDAVVAPLLWGAAAGLPGLLGYRAVNTLDAMIGHPRGRYARFGWAAARADDLANLAPARLTGALACLLAPLVGGRPADAWRVLRRDGAAHPSPNAGRCEAAFAGALGVRLGGANRYGDRLDVRPQLGDGRPPEAGDIARAVRLARAVSLAAALLAVVAAAGRRTPGSRPARR